MISFRMNLVLRWLTKYRVGYIVLEDSDTWQVFEWLEDLQEASNLFLALSPPVLVPS